MKAVDSGFDERTGLLNRVRVLHEAHDFFKGAVLVSHLDGVSLASEQPCPGQYPLHMGLCQTVAFDLCRVVSCGEASGFPQAAKHPDINRQLNDGQ